MRRPPSDGKDGKPFDPARYVDWGLRGPSRMELRPFDGVRPRTFRNKGRWWCQKCLKGPFSGLGVKKHREECS